MAIFIGSNILKVKAFSPFAVWISLQICEDKFGKLDTHTGVNV